jgi:hypothetical protein
MDWKKIAEILNNTIPIKNKRTARQIYQHYEFCLKPNLKKA